MVRRSSSITQADVPRVPREVKQEGVAQVENAMSAIPVELNRTQLRASEIARVYGFSSRHWIRMAAEGRIPGARQPSGVGGVWLFDAVRFASWWESRTRRVESWLGYTVDAEVRYGGVAPSVRTESTGEASRQRIEQLRNAVFGNGSRTSTRSPGARSPGGHSRKHPSGLSESTSRR
jgi:hypothetical protein